MRARGGCMRNVISLFQLVLTIQLKRLKSYYIIDKICTLDYGRNILWDIALNKMNT